MKILSTATLAFFSMVSGAEAGTVILTNPLLEFPDTYSAQITATATSRGPTEQVTISSSSAPTPNFIFQTMPVAQSTGFGSSDASGTVASFFFPSSSSGLSGDVSLSLMGSVGVGLDFPNPGIGAAQILGSASETYSFYIAGPSSTPSSVATTITAKGQAGLGGTGPTPGIYTAIASFSIAGMTLTHNQAVAESSLNDFSSLFNFNQNMNLHTDTVYSFNLSESISGSLTGGECAGLGPTVVGCGVSLSASVDPIIALDVNDPQDYTIFLSPNLTASVPESSTWAMLLIGFTGVSFMLYRRRGAFALA